MTTSKPTSARLLRLPTVEDYTGCKKSFIYASIKAGTFPQPIKIGKASAWVESEVDAWIHARIAETRGIAA